MSYGRWRRGRTRRPASLVLEVRDARPGSPGGRYRLDASADGAGSCAGHRSADLTLDVAELAALWLGDESAVRLAALGRVRGGTSGRRPSGRRPAAYVRGGRGARTSSEPLSRRT